MMAAEINNSVAASSRQELMFTFPVLHFMTECIKNIEKPHRNFILECSSTLNNAFLNLHTTGLIPRKKGSRLIYQENSLSFKELRRNVYLMPAYTHLILNTHGLIKSELEKAAEKIHFSNLNHMLRRMLIVVISHLRTLNVLNSFEYQLFSLIFNKESSDKIYDILLKSYQSPLQVNQHWIAGRKWAHIPTSNIKHMRNIFNFFFSRDPDFARQYKADYDIFLRKADETSNIHDKKLLENRHDISSC